MQFRQLQDLPIYRVPPQGSIAVLAAHRRLRTLYLDFPFDSSAEAAIKALRQKRPDSYLTHARKSGLP